MLLVFCLFVFFCCCCFCGFYVVVLFGGKGGPQTALTLSFTSYSSPYVHCVVLIRRYVLYRLAEDVDD